MTTAAATIATLAYVTPPECQGQMIEASYAAHAGTIYRRVLDRSEPVDSADHVGYSAAPWPEAMDDSWDPANEPPDVGDAAWRNVDGARELED